MCWGKMTSGKFTVSSMYDLVVAEANLSNRRPWHKIWKLKVTPQVKLFIWLLLHGKILTNAERLRKSFTHNPLCYYCPGMVEDLNHILRYCSKVKDLWSKHCDVRQ